jgi:hypothetical protein
MADLCLLPPQAAASWIAPKVLISTPHQMPVISDSTLEQIFSG